MLLLLAACGENAPPTVEGIRLSNMSASRFEEFFVTLVSVEDPDGDVYAGRALVKAKGPETSLEAEVVPFEAEPEKTKGDVIFGATLSGAVELGNWRLEVIYEDEGGAQAAPMTADLELTL